MCYINLHFTYLLTYLLMHSKTAHKECMCFLMVLITYSCAALLGVALSGALTSNFLLTYLLN